MHGNADICAVGPVLPVFFVEQISFRLKKSDLGEREFDLPAVGGRQHRQVAPRRIGDDGLLAAGGNNFRAARGGAAKGGAETPRLRSAPALSTSSAFAR